jgi:hypothetical protein
VAPCFDDAFVGLRSNLLTHDFTEMKVLEQLKDQYLRLDVTKGTSPYVHFLGFVDGLGQSEQPNDGPLPMMALNVEMSGLLPFRLRYPIRPYQHRDVLMRLPSSVIGFVCTSSYCIWPQRELNDHTIFDDTERRECERYLTTRALGLTTSSSRSFAISWIIKALVWALCSSNACMQSRRTLPISNDACSFLAAICETFFLSFLS